MATIKRRRSVTPIAEHVAKWHDLKDQSDAVASALAAEKDIIIAHMERNGRKNLTVDFEGKSYSVTKIQATSVRIDEAKLQKGLGAKLWEKVTTRVLDKKKLEAYMASGEVDATVVAKCSEDHENAPYLKR